MMRPWREVHLYIGIILAGAEVDRALKGSMAREEMKKALEVK
jgi:hypothetical protein